MTSLWMDDLTDNAFLGGKLRIMQPRRGYRAGIDPVLLAAACAAKPGARVLELGCGVGTALFCLGARLPGLELTGVEISPALADLARENARRNGIDARIVTADLGELPANMRQQGFDLVLANPPFFDRGASAASPDPQRETGRGEGRPLSDWLAVATRRLRPGGQAVFIHRTERLPDLLAVAGGLGALRVTPLAPREGRAAKLVLLRARKGAAHAFRLDSPIVLHRGARHEADAESYTDAINAVLREGAALPDP